MLKPSPGGGFVVGERELSYGFLLQGGVIGEFCRGVGGGGGLCRTPVSEIGIVDVSQLIAKH